MSKIGKIIITDLTFSVFAVLFSINSASAQNIKDNKHSEAKEQVSKWEYECKKANCSGYPEWTKAKMKREAIRELSHWIPIYRSELYAARMQARKDKNILKTKDCNRILKMEYCNKILYCNRILSELDELEEKYIDGVETLYPIVEDGKYGYINRKGEVVIEPQFGHITGILGGAGSAMKGDKWYLIISKDIIVEVSEATRLVNGMALVGVNGKYGYIDKTGKMVIKPQYEMACEFSRGLAAVEVDGKWGYIKKNGEFVIYPQYDRAGSFNQGLAAVQKNGKCGYINYEGDMVVEIKPRPFYYYDEFWDGLAAVRVDGKWGYINKQGELVIKNHFNDPYHFSEGLARVGMNDELEYFGDDGNPYGGAEWKFKYGYIDKTGKTVIKPIYDEADSFSDGVASVKKDGKWFFIDQEGNEIFSKKFSSCGSFNKGLAYVKIGGKIAYIDRNGDFVWKEK